MLTGHPPFQAGSSLETLEQVRSLEPIPPRQVQPRMARDLETICLKCLQKDPRRRYATGQALAADLRRFLDGRPVTARRPVGSLEHGWRWCRRRPLVAGLVAGLVLVMIAGFSVSFVSWRQAEGQAARAEISEAAALASLHKEEAA